MNKVITISRLAGKERKDYESWHWSFNAYEDLLYEERKACKIKLFWALVKLPYFTKINEKQL